MDKMMLSILSLNSVADWYAAACLATVPPLAVIFISIMTAGLLGIIGVLVVHWVLRAGR